MKKGMFILCIGCLLTACGGKTDRTYWQLSQQPVIFPDYTDITIPYNIAPLNFQVEEDSAEISVSALITGIGRYEFKSHSALVQFPEKEWRKMLEAEKGNTLQVYLTVTKDNQDLGYQGFNWTIASEPIDKYLSYRLIEPAYEVWNMLQIEERDLENFNTRLLGDNNITGHTCINCHISNHAQEPATFMHVRGKEGGTVYARNGRVRKINTKTDTTGVAVYGEISNNGRFGIFTTADIIPILHSLRGERLEVYDRRSDLIAVDFENGTVSDSPAVSGETYQETFPCFSADNRTVYFCRAPHLPQPDSTKEMRYNLYSIAFDPETGALGDSVRLVFDAARLGKSVSFPKCSPDGKYLLMSVSDYGTFPIWHPETDLWMLNLSGGQIDSMKATNGRYSDSWHSWNGNSRWIAFASKRDDRVYGRPYFACVNEDGSTTKAFVLPQKNPGYYRRTLKSFNIPELYSVPEIYDAHRIQQVYFHGKAENFNYKKSFIKQ